MATLLFSGRLSGKYRYILVGAAPQGGIGGIAVTQI